jgi:UDP-GlcNAc:undecaprenyl-phosphate GlcNAc-1-phosphate transferase
MSALLLVAGAAAVTAAAVTPAARRLALRTRLLDGPGERTSQRTPVPLLGGAVLLVGAAAGAAVAALAGAPAPGPGLAGGALAAFLIGLWDDRRKERPLGWRPKLAGQLGAVLWFVLLDRPAPGPVLAALWMLAVVNAWNFFDNADGSLAAVGAVAALALAALGPPEVAWTAAALGGALLGFLPWNLPPARAYAGDAGSHLAGFVLGALPLLAARPGASVPPVLLAAALALPLLDLVQVVIVRLALGLSPARGDRRHLAHRLERLGLGPRAALAVLVATAAALAALPVLGRASL